MSCQQLPTVAALTCQLAVQHAVGEREEAKAVADQLISSWEAAGPLGGVVKAAAGTLAGHWQLAQVGLGTRVRAQM